MALPPSTPPPKKRPQPDASPEPRPAAATPESTPRLQRSDSLCAVCLSPLHSPLERTACKHVFHQQCLDQVKAHGQTQCPMCRAGICDPSELPRLQRQEPQELSQRELIASNARRAREAFRRRRLEEGRYEPLPLRF